jgi:phosphate-selective porin OprO/OprP
MKRFTLLIVILSMSLGNLSLARAESLEKKINDLEQKQKILERKWELEQEKQKESGVQLSAGKDGFLLKANNYSLKFDGLLQVDGRFYPTMPQNLGADTFVVRRARPIFSGTFYDRFSWIIMPDFGSGQVVLQDGFIDTRFIPEIKVRGGKFKEPIGLERLQSDSQIPFVERALPSDLTPNRSVGFQVFGDIIGSVITYNLGIFNDVVDGGNGDINNFNGKTLAARIFAKPFLKAEIDSLKDLGIGFGGSYGSQSGNSGSPNLPVYQTVGLQTFFSYLPTAQANGTFYHLSPQAYYYWGPFGFLGEYIRSTQNVTTSSTPATLTHQSWQTQLSYVLTGEKNSYTGVSPRNPLNPSEGKWGAFQLAARYNELRIDPNAFPLYANAAVSAQRARGYGVAADWYLNDVVKVIADFEQTFFVGGATVGNRPSEKVIEARLQVAF